MATVFGRFCITLIQIWRHLGNTKEYSFSLLIVFVSHGDHVTISAVGRKKEEGLMLFTGFLSQIGAKLRDWAAGRGRLLLSGSIVLK